jgi:predicted ATP-grasp superfamily ATP-dependent carboligase
MTPAARTPAVVVSGHTMALAVVRSLGEAGVPVAVMHYDARDIAQASRYVVAGVTLPHPLTDEERFVDALVDEGRRFDGAILIPASDEAAVAVSRHKARLQERYVVAAPEWEVTERFIDKSRTAALADANGIPAPRTVVPRSPEDLDALAAEIGLPLLLKPAESHLFFERFRRKMFRVETLADLRTRYALAVDAGLTVMLQEIIPGPDSSVVNYNAYFWQGEALAEFTARQLRKAPPALGSPRVAVSERIPAVIEPGRAILRAMGFYGFACTEFKLDLRDGTYKLIEVNGRHNLSGLLAVRCGVNFPLMQYRHLVEGVLPTPAPFRQGVYWTDVFRDAGYTLAYLRRQPIRPTDFVKPYARRHCDAILDRHDMAPFWARFRYLARNIGSMARPAGADRTGPDEKDSTGSAASAERSIGTRGEG